MTTTNDVLWERQEQLTSTDGSNLTDLLLEDLLNRIANIEQRLNCKCADYHTNADIKHSEWCPSYIKPTTRVRTCYKCNGTGQQQNQLLTGGEFALCTMCNGQGEVPEIWIDGSLVWPE